MVVLSWLCRCVPGLSILVLLGLVECSLQILQTEYISLSYPTFLVKHVNPAFAQGIFIFYSLLLHILSFAFPLRLASAVWRATKAIEAAHADSYHPDGTSSGVAEAEEDVEENKIASAVVMMAILIPSYKEEIHILEDTLKVLASHSLAQSSYDIFLAMEERDPNALSTAVQLKGSFQAYFNDMQFTMHPGNILDEAPGKSSNISWAAKEVERKYQDNPNWKDVMVTVMDSDTHLMSQYFNLVRQRHMRNRQQGDSTDMTLYMPPIVFDRNASHVPALVRVADLMWCGAGLSCYQDKPSRTGVGIPTAVYTLPLALVRLVQGWDTGPGAIGEDMHMMLKCYFATNGRLAVESIPSPASQCNVTTGQPGIRGWVLNLRARYTQGLRHMWGCLDTGFAISNWFSLGKKTASSTPRQRQVHRKVSHTDLDLKLSQLQLHGHQPTKFTWRNLVLFVRIFEAHFLPSHLCIVMLASVAYGNFAAPIVHCHWLSLSLDITGAIRAISFAVMLLYFFVCYERYHRVCVMVREAEMKRAGLYEEMKGTFSWRQKWHPFTWIDYLVFPIAGTLFGSVPLIHAAFAHFWSDRLVYTVSAKPKKVIEV